MRTKRRGKKEIPKVKKGKKKKKKKRRSIADLQNMKNGHIDGSQHPIQSFG